MADILAAARLAAVCDGTPAASRRVARVLRNDSSIAVFRHADPGYEEVVTMARREGLMIPALGGAGDG